MSMLPIIEIDNKHYFVDRRLNQIRNVDNPNDYTSFDNEFHLREFFQKNKAKIIHHN